MPVEINTTESRLTSFEDHVLAELMRLQCREAELVATINELQQQMADLQDEHADCVPFRRSTDPE